MSSAAVALVDVEPLNVVDVPVEVEVVTSAVALTDELVVISARPTPAAAANARPMMATAIVRRRKRFGRCGTGLPPVEDWAYATAVAGRRENLRCARPLSLQPEQAREARRPRPRRLRLRR